MSIYRVTARNPSDLTEELHETFRAVSRSHAILRMGALLSQSEALRLTKVTVVDITYETLTAEDRD